MESNVGEPAGTIIVVIVAALFVLIGVLILSGRGGRLIAGYNTMSKEQREKINEKALFKLMGRLMIVLAAILVLMNFATDRWQFVSLLVLFLVLVVGAVIFINKSPRFRK
jgi:preprotein translocase subunit SecG